MAYMGVEFNDQFATRVALLCYDKFNALPKSGKPITGREWTSLAAVVRSNHSNEADGSGANLRVVSMATGSKCIGESKLSPNGDVINDSHAEVLARRAFLTYLYEQIESTRGESSSELFSRNEENGRLNVREGIQFHLFTSEIPCGDAAIFPKLERTSSFVDSIRPGIESLKENVDTVLAIQVPRNEVTVNSAMLDSPTEGDTHRKRHSFSNDGFSAKKPKTVDQIKLSTCGKFVRHVGPLCLRDDSSADSDHEGSVGNVMTVNVGDDVIDIHRTGAKCLPNEAWRDSKESGHRYHVIGVVRTKPGRGDPTLSVSCSDKILRWNCVGIQGALLSLLVEPIYLASVIVASHPNRYSHEAMYRAVVCRNAAQLLEIRRSGHSPPVLLRTDVEFQFGKRTCARDAKPSPCSIIWCDLASRNHQVCVEGRRLGVTRKSARSESPFVSKRQLLQVFKSLTTPRFDHLNYYEIKALASRYQNKWQRFKLSIGNWTHKDPRLLQFG